MQDRICSFRTTSYLSVCCRMQISHKSTEQVIGEDVQLPASVSARWRRKLFRTRPYSLEKRRGTKYATGACWKRNVLARRKRISERNLRAQWDWEQSSSNACVWQTLRGISATARTSCALGRSTAKWMDDWSGKVGCGVAPEALLLTSQEECLSGLGRLWHTKYENLVLFIFFGLKGVFLPTTNTSVQTYAWKNERKKGLHLRTCSIPCTRIIRMLQGAELSLLKRLTRDLIFKTASSVTAAPWGELTASQPMYWKGERGKNPLKLPQTVGH